VKIKGERDYKSGRQGCIEYIFNRIDYETMLTDGKALLGTQFYQCSFAIMYSEGTELLTAFSVK
jgi:hypothetical protein